MFLILRSVPFGNYHTPVFGFGCNLFSRLLVEQRSQGTSDIGTSLTQVTVVGIFPVIRWAQSLVVHLTDESHEGILEARVSSDRPMSFQLTRRSSCKTLSRNVRTKSRESIMLVRKETDRQKQPTIKMLAGAEYRRNECCFRVKTFVRHALHVCCHVWNWDVVRN